MVLPGRSAHDCRHRWNQLIRKTKVPMGNSRWTAAEDDQLIATQALYGNQWELITSYLPGRSACACKKHWNGLTQNKAFKKRTVKAFTRQSQPAPTPVPAVLTFQIPVPAVLTFQIKKEKSDDAAPNATAPKPKRAYTSRKSAADKIPAPRTVNAFKLED
jgi:hypothetical protein